MKILLIEDNPGDARLVREILREASGSFTINNAEKLSLGIKFLASHDVDVVLLDLNLPDSSGLETLTQLQAQFSHLPIVIMTGSSDEELGVQAVQLGAQDYLVKGQGDKGLLHRALLYAIERKRMERALRDNEKELSTILTNIPLLTLVVDSERHVLQANTVAAGFAGRSVEEMMGPRAGEALRCLNSLDDPRGCGFGSACQTCLTRLTILDAFETGNNHSNVEWHLPFFRAGKREETTFLLSTVLLTTPVKRVLVCIEDITKRKQKEEEVRGLNEELRRRASDLEAANKELEAFSYSVSHDLRAPLRSMDGFSNILLEDYGDKLDAQGKECLDHIRSSSQLMAQLIDDMLKLSRVGRADMKWENANLSEIAQSIVEELKRTQPERKAEFIIPQGIAVQGDKSLLRILLQNLLENAWKYTNKVEVANIEFGVTLMDTEKIYYVKDNGVGFDMTYANKLFHPFQRLHSNKEFPGTGIGLAIVQRIISRHRGKDWAQSKSGEGATFYFTLGEEKSLSS